MADKDFVVKNNLTVNGALTANSSGLYFSNTLSLNSTSYQGTSNNTLNVGSVAAANVVSNSQLQSNLANYVQTAALTNLIGNSAANSAQFLGPAGSALPYTYYARIDLASACTGGPSFQKDLTVNTALTVLQNTVNVGTTLYVFANGNVGLGNTTPADKLSVTGNASVSSTIKVGFATVNSTNYTGLANDVLNVSGYPAYYVVNTSTLASNLANYTNTTITQGWISTNSATAYTNAVSDTKTFVAANYPNNTQLTANLSNYETLSDLTSRAYVNTSQLSSNLANYTNTASLVALAYVNTAQLSSNLANYTNTATLATYYVNTTGSYTTGGNIVMNGNLTVNNNLIISNTAGVYANNSLGSFGQLLQSTGDGVVWVNAANVVASVTAPGANTYVIFNDGGIQSAVSGFTFNKTTNTVSVGTATINSTNYSQTANNTLFVGSTAAANVVSNAQLVANLSNYTVTTTVQGWITSNTSAAYTNAIAYSGNAAQAYSNAVGYANTQSYNAWTNAVTYAATIAATAYSNAIAYSGNAAQAYTNAIAYSGNAAQAYSNAVDRKSTRLNSSHTDISRMPSSA